MRKRIFLVLVFIVLIGLTPSLPYVFGKDKPDKPDKPHKPKKVKEIEVLLEYEYSVYYPPNSPAMFIPYTILDGNNVNIGSGITDATGMITFAILTSYNQGNGKGIHIEFMWQGTLVSIDNLVSGAYIELLTPFVSGDIVFRWEDLSLLDNQLINAWFEGVDLTVVSLNFGALTNFKMMVGTYTFKCAEFEDIIFVLSADYATQTVAEDFTVITKFERVSRYW